MTTIFTSHKFSLDKCPPNLRKNLGLWDSLNPSYDFKYYNDEEMKTWMKENASEETFALFSRLNTGAGRADMFRICHLHIDGGVWIDTDLPAFDINQQCPKFEEMLVENQAVLVRNRKCDNPRYTFIASIKENKLFSMLENHINHHIEQAINNRSSAGTINITGPFVLHKLLLTMCGFEDVVKAGPRSAWPQGYAFHGTIPLDVPHEVDGANFIYINDIAPERKTYDEENVYAGYAADLRHMNVTPHGGASAITKTYMIREQK